MNRNTLWHCILNFQKLVCPVPPCGGVLASTFSATVNNSKANLVYSGCFGNLLL